jgi:hypothetical protein
LRVNDCTRAWAIMNATISPWSAVVQSHDAVHPDRDEPPRVALEDRAPNGPPVLCSTFARETAIASRMRSSSVR